MSENTNPNTCNQPVEGTDGITCGRLPGHGGTHRQYLTRKAQREANKGASKSGPVTQAKAPSKAAKKAPKKAAKKAAAE